MRKYGYTFSKLEGTYTKALDLRFIIIFAGFLFWIFSFMASGENLLSTYLLFGFFYILLAMLGEVLPWVGLALLIIFTMVVALAFLEPHFLYHWRATPEQIRQINFASVFFIFYNFTVTFSALFALRNEIKTNKSKR